MLYKQNKKLALPQSALNPHTKLQMTDEFRELVLWCLIQRRGLKASDYGGEKPLKGMTSLGSGRCGLGLVKTRRRNVQLHGCRNRECGSCRDRGCENGVES